MSDLNDRYPHDDPDQRAVNEGQRSRSPSSTIKRQAAKLTATDSIARIVLAAEDLLLDDGDNVMDGDRLIDSCKCNDQESE